MQTVFLACVVIGGVVLLGQILLGMFGIDSHEDSADHVDTGGSHAALGLDLLSVRSLAAATAVFGAAGLILDSVLPGWLAAVIAVAPAFGAAWATAWLMRMLVRFDSSGTLDLEGAIGAIGTVYLRVPEAGSGAGLVQVPLQGRTVELRAITRGGDVLATGASVLVVSVDPESEIVEVVPTSKIEELA